MGNRLVSRGGQSQITGIVPPFETRPFGVSDQSNTFGITIHGPGINHTFCFEKLEGTALSSLNEVVFLLILFFDRG